MVLLWYVVSSKMRKISKECGNLSNAILNERPVVGFAGKVVGSRYSVKIIASSSTRKISSGEVGWEYEIQSHPRPTAPQRLGPRFIPIVLVPPGSYV